VFNNRTHKGSLEQDRQFSRAWAALEGDLSEQEKLTEKGGETGGGGNLSPAHEENSLNR